MHTDGVTLTDNADSLEKQRALLQLSLKYLCGLAVGAFVLSAILCIALSGYLIPRELTGSDRTHFYLAYFTVSLLANLAAASAIYLISYLATRKYTQFQIETLAQTLVIEPLLKRVREAETDGITEYQSLWQVPWDDVIAGANSTIDVCVQGWDGLVEHYKQAWVKFFTERGGKVNLILPSITHANGSISHMANRMMKTVEQQVEEIRNTHVYLDNIQKKINAGTVKLYEFDPMIWYCLIRIDERVAYLSFYEHVHDMMVDSAVFKIDLARYPKTKAWIEKELAGLMNPETITKKTIPAGASERGKRNPRL